MKFMSRLAYTMRQKIKELNVINFNSSQILPCIEFLKLMSRMTYYDFNMSNFATEAIRTHVQNDFASPILPD